MKCVVCDNPVTFPGSRYCEGCFDGIRESIRVSLNEPDPKEVDWDIISRITPWLMVFFVGLCLGYAWAWNALGGTL